MNQITPHTLPSRDDLSIGRFLGLCGIGISKYVCGIVQVEAMIGVKIL